MQSKNRNVSLFATVAVIAFIAEVGKMTELQVSAVVEMEVKSQNQNYLLMATVAVVAVQN